MKTLPDIQAEGERIARETTRSGDGSYLWTDLVGAIQTAMSEERARNSELAADFSRLRETLSKSAMVNSPRDPELVKFLEGVVGVVEANSYEKMMLWVENSRRETPLCDSGLARMKWESSNHGIGRTIGYLASRPIHLGLIVNVINGHRILFLDVTSTVVDHDLIRDWLLTVLPASAIKENGYVRYEDAENLYAVLPR